MHASERMGEWGRVECAVVGHVGADECEKRR